MGRTAKALALSLLFGSAGCRQELSVSLDAIITCTTNDECLAPLPYCDPVLLRCVVRPEPFPVAMLTVTPKVGPRSTAFVFNAVGSSVPDGGALGYAWEIEGMPGDAGDFNVSTGNSPRLTHRFDLPRGAFCTPGSACEQAVSRTVRLRVTSAAGHTAETEASVVIENSAPVADFGEDLFVAETGVPFVTLDVCGGVVRDAGCTARDPDQGDVLAFTGWRLVAGPTDGGLTQVGAGLARFTPPDRWTRPFVFEADVSDGVETVTGRVRVYQRPIAWAGLTLTNATFRIHPDFRFATTWRRQGGGEVLFTSPDSVAATVDGYWIGDSDPITNTTMVVHFNRELVELERWELAGNSSVSWRQAVRSLVPPSSGRLGCATIKDLSGAAGGSSFVRFGSPDAGLLSRRHVLDGGWLPWQVLPAGGTGDCWTLANQVEYPWYEEVGSAEVGRITESGAWRRVELLTQPYADAVAEPNGTLWVAEYVPAPLADGGYPINYTNAGRTRLHRYPLQGPAATFELSGGYLETMAAHHEGGLWASESHGKVLRITSTGQVLDTRIGPLSGSMAWDPAERALWLADSWSGALIRMVEADAGLVLDGRVAAEELPANREGFRLGFNRAVEVAVDPVTGAAVTSVGGQNQAYVQWATVPSHLERLERVQGTLVWFAGDPSSGHVWSVDERRIRRSDARGRVLFEAEDGYDSWWTRQLVVDRAGRAWVVSKNGALVELRSFDPDGTRGPTIRIPAVPFSLQLEGDTMCGTGEDRGAFRVKVSAGTSEVLDVQRRESLYASNAPGGGCWIAANDAPDGGGVPPVFAMRYVGGQTTPVGAFGIPLEPVLMPPAAPATSVSIAGLVHEPWLGGVYVATRLGGSATSASSVRYFEPDGGGGTGVDFLGLQNVVGGTGSGMALGLAIRDGCESQTRACRDIWVNNHLARVTRYDGWKRVVDDWPLAVGATDVWNFSLVP